MVPPFASHPGDIPPKGASQGRNRYSKSSRCLLPCVANIAQRQDRAAPIAKHLNNLVEFQVSVDLACPGAVCRPVRKFFRSAQGFEPPELRDVPMKRSLERDHEKAIDVARGLHNTGAIEVARHLGDRGLHEVGGVARIGGERLSSPAGTIPDSVRGRSHVTPNRSSQTIDVSIPPKRNVRTAHAAPRAYRRRESMAG